ncbi:hypothetical protein BREVUG8_100647 [Brevundimonas sp. G8]|nr:hypothetical protein BREVUG8_100647 [Brevundimonas sp. G8]
MLGVLKGAFMTPVLGMSDDSRNLPSRFLDGAGRAILYFGDT